MAEYSVLPAGDTSLVVDFGNRVDLQLSKRVLALARRLDALRIAGVVETVPTVRSLSVYYEPLRISYASLQARVHEMLEHQDLQSAPALGRNWQIGVCYDPDLAPDLGDVATRCGLSAGQLVEWHSSINYHVYMLGFLPGLAYLGDLPEQLALPRRETPRPRISGGSVGIGGRMTCIYPTDTPCGWHLIGRSPVALWDQAAEHGALLSAGDAVKFTPISLREFERARSDPTSAVQQVSC
jgi:inhibitor of KinA